MKQPAPFTVTEDTFPSCWEQIDRLRRKARRMSVIARLGGFLTNLFFLFSLLFLANGLIYAHFHGPYHAFLDSLPVFPELWASITGFLLRPGDSLTAEVLKLLLGAYGISILVFIVLALVIAVIYHPLRRPLPEGTYEARTALLAKAAQEALARSYMTKLSTSIASTLLVITAAFILFFSYTVYRQDAVAVTALLSKFPTQDPLANSQLYVLAAYFVCSFFSTILLLLSRFIYRYQFPYHRMAETETAALFAREDPAEQSQEAIQDQRRARAAELRQSALSLETEAAYSKAKSMLHEAALMGDVPAMEHFARHCLLSHLNDSARYWLERCVSSGEASRDAQRMLLRLRLRLRHKEQYLRPEAAPLSKWQKVLRVLQQILTVLWRVFFMLLFLGSLIVMILLFKNNFDPSVLQDIPSAFSQLLP